MRIVSKLIGLTILCAATLVAKADNETSMLANTCLVCHGNNGASIGPAIPNLSSMSRNYLMGAMLAFKYEAEDELNAVINSDHAFADVEAFNRNSTIMNRIAKGYTEDEIKNLAEYFSEQELSIAQQEVNPSQVQLGKKLHTKYCASCHENEGKSSDDDTGVLAGQWKPYFLYTMSDYLDGSRAMPKKMKNKLKKMLESSGEDSLIELANYYASVSR